MDLTKKNANNQVVWNERCEAISFVCMTMSFVCERYFTIYMVHEVLYIEIVRVIEYQRAKSPLVVSVGSLR